MKGLTESNRFFGGIKKSGKLIVADTVATCFEVNLFTNGFVEL